MDIKQAKFIISNTSVAKCPKPDRPEYAFIGRSNVGKSSLINMLTNSKSLAKTSSQPGKTQLINHFMINDEWYLVDLPGYGYAKAPKTERKKWEKFIRQYIIKRPNLYCLFVLIDIRHEPQLVDLEFIEWLGINQIPFAIVFTKSDKLKPEEVDPKVHEFKAAMLEKWNSLPDIFITSAEKFEGKKEILGFIDQVNKAT
jgi:GTP-binding protein